MNPIESHAIKDSETGLSGRLDQVFKCAVENRRLVGAVGVVFHKGTVIYRKSHGLACLEKNEPMGIETLFRFSSVTKPIVTAAMLKLVARKQLRLDDPVTTWLPYFTPREIDGTEPSITIHHLLLFLTKYPLLFFVSISHCVVV
jgi:CubicO group peptidase (beta-lactamase class C family)